MEFAGQSKEHQVDLFDKITVHKYVFWAIVWFQFFSFKHIVIYSDYVA
jgi:hypothetical protein